MVKISRRLLFTIFIAFLVVTPFVFGADFLDPIFQSFRGTNLGQTYVNYAPFIDAIIYIWLFIAIAKKAMPEKMGGQVATALGIMLGISMCVFELTSKFNIGKLGPFAAIILFLVIGMFLYNLMKGFTGNTWAAMSVAFLIIYSVAKWIVPSLFDWMGQVGWLGSVLAIMFLVSIIGLIYGIFSLFKGIKSGEWGSFKAKQQQGEAGKTFHNINRREEIEANRKKRAAENMFKLETEMGNLNNSIKQLEQAETNDYNKNLHNRQNQIQLLADLSNTLNRSWELQKQLQEAYGKASMPAYAENTEYLNTIKQSTQQLDDFLRRIRDLLQKLYDGVVNTEKDERDADVQIRNEFDLEIKKLEDTLRKYENALATIKTYTETDKTNATIEDLKSIEDIAKQRKDILLKVKETQALLEKNRNAVLLEDQQNIADLKHAIEVSDANPAKNLNVLVRGINIGQNASQIKERYNDAQGVLGTIGSLINLRNQYLSGDNLRQIYQSVKNVHDRLQEIVVKINQEKTQITNKNTLLTTFNNLQAALQTKKANVIQTHLTASKKAFENDKTQLQLFQDKLKIYYNNNRKSDIEMNKKIITDYKKEFSDIIITIKDKALRDLLTKEVNYIIKELGQYNEYVGKIDFNSAKENALKNLNNTYFELEQYKAEFIKRYQNYIEVINLEYKFAQSTNNIQTQAQPKLNP